MKNSLDVSFKIIAIIAGIIVALLSALSVWGQSSTQTIRGRILDEVSKTPRIGVTVVVTDLSPAPGSTTHAYGGVSAPLDGLLAFQHGKNLIQL